MLLIREVFHCRPGKVRPFVEKFLAMAKLTEQAGQGKMRIMTDLAGERFWTIVAEMEAPTLQAFEEMMQGKGMDEKTQKELERIMGDYHELVDQGHREIFKIEG